MDYLIGIGLVLGVSLFIWTGLHFGERCIDRMFAVKDFEMPFKPGVFYHREDRITEILLRDCFTVWCPLAGTTAHFVDLGYDAEGDLVGIRVWGDVRENDRPTRSICEGADLLNKLYPVSRS